jgi:hypothetical protein
MNGDAWTRIVATLLDWHCPRCGDAGAIAYDVPCGNTFCANRNHTHIMIEECSFCRGQSRGMAALATVVPWHNWPRLGPRFRG